VESKGLRDDTTCIVIDIVPPEKPKSTIESPKTPGKGLGLLKSFFLRKTVSDSLSLADKDNYPEPDFVEEVFEDGCPSLSRRFVNLTSSGRITVNKSLYYKFKFAI
jgi:hypothetical protein